LHIDPFGGAKPRLLRRGKEQPLRVNPEPLGFTRGLEFVERQTQALVLSAVEGSGWGVEGLTILHPLVKQ